MDGGGCGICGASFPFWSSRHGRLIVRLDRSKIARTARGLVARKVKLRHHQIDVDIAIPVNYCLSIQIVA